MNVGLLMLLIIYLFAIIGVQYFCDMKFNFQMTRLLNFQTLPKAYLTLFGVATGDGWNDLLEALSMEASVSNHCIKNPTYADYVANNKQPIGCGSRTFATFYFFSFVFMISIIFMNLFIAIILEGYFLITEKEKIGKVNSQFELFR